MTNVLIRRIGSLPKKLRKMLIGLVGSQYKVNLVFDLALTQDLVLAGISTELVLS